MKRLLVGYDFTAGSARALARALRLAARTGAAVEVVHAAPGGNCLPDQPSAHRRLLAEARIMAEELGADRIEVSACLRSGDAGEVIVAESERFDADLVVLGARGELRLRDPLFGTTATHVARHGSCAILMAQHDDSKAYAKVMVALGDPDAAQPLLGTAFAVAPDAATFAIHAFSPTLKQALAGDVERERARLRGRIEAAVTAAAADAGGTSLDLHVSVETGEVMTVLMEQYEALEPDLLAIGTRSDATYLGSHAVDAIFWCPRDLLVVPEGAKIISGNRAPNAARLSSAPASA